MFAVFLERHGGKGWWAAWSVWAGASGSASSRTCAIASPDDARPAPARPGARSARAPRAARRRLVVTTALAPAALAAARADCAALRDAAAASSARAHPSAVRRARRLCASRRARSGRRRGLRDARAARALALELDGASVGPFDGPTARRCRCGWACRSTRSSRSTARRRPRAAARLAAALPAAAREPVDAAPRHGAPRQHARERLTHRSGHAAALGTLFRPPRRGEVTAVLYLGLTERPAARAPRRRPRGCIHATKSQRASTMCSHCLSTLAITRPTVLADAARLPHFPVRTTRRRAVLYLGAADDDESARPRRVSCASRPSAGGSCCSTRADPARGRAAPPR